MKLGVQVIHVSATQLINCIIAPKKWTFKILSSSCSNVFKRFEENDQKMYF